MPIPHNKVRTPRGLVMGHHWKGAIKSNGSKPTIFPHVGVPGHIHGFQHKTDMFGHWTKTYHGKHR